MTEQILDNGCNHKHPYKREAKLLCIKGHYWIDIYTLLYKEWASLVAQTVKNMPAIQETRVPVFDPWDSHGYHLLEPGTCTGTLSPR